MAEDKLNKVSDPVVVEEPSKKKKKDKKIAESDFKRAEAELKKELNKRKTSRYRTNAEGIWKNVDRQVALQPMDTIDADPEEEWLNQFDTGDIAIASENLTGDLLRTVFPDARNWFDPHVVAPVNLNPATGENIPLPKKLQEQLDGRIRAMMTQQHIDFGLRDRVELSLKEALHHGMFVVEVKEETIEFVTGDKIKEVSAPVWVPHSMWNCYPDPSPSLVGESMFYRGSIFIRSYMPRHALMEMATGEGWMKKALKTIPKRENAVKDDSTHDVELDTYWGTVKIPVGSDGMTSSDSDMFFPNHKAILANGKLVYLAENRTPYPPIIVKGYEKMDVRDIYAFSPIIKQSPMQDITSILANEYVNGVQLHVRPPIVYDANDPKFITNGGPRISPGAKTATQGSTNFTQLKIGDPQIALEGVKFGTQKMKEALGRPGVQVGDRASATEVMTKQADSEAGPFAFAIKVDAALRTFLHIQHYLNSTRKGFRYSYYCQEIDAPDSLVVDFKDLPEEIHFEIVGTKGVLGQVRRQAAFTQVSTLFMGNSLTQPLLEISEIVKQTYLDAGVKNPERFLKQSDGIPPEVKATMDKMQQVIQQLQGELKDSETQNAVKLKGQELNHEAKMAKTESSHQTAMADLKLRAETAQANHEIATGKQAQDAKVAHLERIIREFEHVVEKTVLKHSKATKPTKGAMGLSLPAVHPETGHVLHQDAAGNQAYVGPAGEITEVNNAPV